MTADAELAEALDPAALRAEIAQLHKERDRWRVAVEASRLTCESVERDVRAIAMDILSCVGENPGAEQLANTVAELTAALDAIGVALLPGVPSRSMPAAEYARRVQNAAEDATVESTALASELGDLLEKYGGERPTGRGSYLLDRVEAVLEQGRCDWEELRVSRERLAAHEKVAAAAPVPLASVPARVLFVGGLRDPGVGLQIGPASSLVEVRIPVTRGEAFALAAELYGEVRLLLVRGQP